MPRDVRAPILGSLACALMLPVLAFAAYKVGGAAHADAALLHRLSRPQGSVGYSLAESLSGLANPLPFLAILTGVLAVGMVARRGRETLAAVAVVVGANVSTQLFKQLLEHERFHAFLGPHQPSNSAFPSGHTTAAASLSVALLLVVPARLRPLAAAAGVAFTAAVGLGVVVIEDHYPSDVLGGLCVVGAWGLAAVAVLRLLRDRDPDAPPREERERASGTFAVSLH